MRLICTKDFRKRSDKIIELFHSCLNEMVPIKRKIKCISIKECSPLVHTSSKSIALKSVKRRRMGMDG